MSRSGHSVESLVLVRWRRWGSDVPVSLRHPNALEFQVQWVAFDFGVTPTDPISSLSLLHIDDYVRLSLFTGIKREGGWESEEGHEE